jgi:signal transduction histidine kinase
MVLVPLGLTAWLGQRLVRSEQRLMRQGFEELALAQLEEHRRQIQAELESRERSLLGEPALLGARTPEALRAFARKNPLVSGVLVLDARGRLAFPPPGGPRSRQEEEFLERAAALLADRGALLAPPGEEGSPAAPATKRLARPGASSLAPAAPARHGWYSWFHGSDLALLFWQRDGERVLGVELDRARFLADVMARLPEGGGLAPREGPLAAYALLDARGEVLYRWGAHLAGEGEAPVARLALPPPLGAWQLVMHSPSSGLGAGHGGALALWLGLASLGLALGGLAWLFYREHLRGLRLAERRVSFVNHVSHELKTPLTNIRLYAELLERALPEDDPDAARYLGVVVSEGQRLGRLIDNVLTFGRHQRGALRLRTAPGVVDEVVARAVEGFRPALDARGVEVELELGAPARVRLDADALTQILDNLLGNVEKYAAEGRLVRISTHQAVGLSVLAVADRGPGIPAPHRERVFAPFERLGDALTEGAAGAGIGLSVVRELARLHGGEARCLESAAGARFEVSLRTPGEEEP